MTKILYILILFPYFNLFAIDYYVSNDGNDSNNGKSPKTSFSTINRVNQLNLKPGDRILFKKGDVFYGELEINQGGIADKPIIISSFGEKEAAKPLLKGATKLTKWEKVEGQLYSAIVKQPVKQLYADGKYLNPGRIPNVGYFYMDEDGDKESLIDEELDTYKNLVGSRVHVQTVNWQWEIRKIAQQSKGKVKLDSLLWHPTKTDFGYYIENNFDFVDISGEWYYNKKESKLYLMWEGSISDVELHAVFLDNAIRIKNAVSNVEIEGVSIEYYNNAAINVGEKANNINVRGNEISNIEVFGILMKMGCRNSKIESNRITDVQGRGISTLEPQNCKFIANQIKRIGMIAGRGFDGVNSGVAICMENREHQDVKTQVIAMHNLIAKNRVDSTGYGGIRADGAYNTIEYNVVRETVLTMNDGAGIYTWGRNYAYSHHSVFRKNVVVNVYGNTESCAGHHKIICALYMDNYSNNSLIEDNVFVCAETGIILNDLS